MNRVASPSIQVVPANKNVTNPHVTRMNDEREIDEKLKCDAMHLTLYCLTLRVSLRTRQVVNDLPDKLSG